MAAPLFEPRPEVESPPRRIRLDRNELAGAFGDLGTDLPLIVGMILAAGLDSGSVLTAFGLMQIFTALSYRLPMPVQPLKAVATIVIAQHTGPNVIYGAGLAIGVVMLVLGLLGAIDWLARVVPKSVIRGIQFGLGLQLATIALREYVRADGIAGYWLAGVAFAITVLLIGNRRLPAALPVVALGLIYAFALRLGPFSYLPGAIGLRLPPLHVPELRDVLTGLVVLAIPQIPLSLGNSILATRQIVEDCYPGVKLGVRKIALTYSAMNLVSPFLGGVPTCHGSGGFAGHYAFGARTGGSVLIYGALYLGLGLFLSAGFAQVVQVFPLPMLGVLLLFEGLALIVLVRDVAGSRSDFAIAGLVGLAAALVPYGYVIGLVTGTLLAHLAKRGLTGLAR